MNCRSDSSKFEDFIFNNWKYEFNQYICVYDDDDDTISNNKQLKTHDLKQAHNSIVADSK